MITQAKRIVGLAFILGCWLALMWFGVNLIGAYM
jgi:hypothetical protein